MRSRIAILALEGPQPRSGMRSDHRAQAFTDAQRRQHRPFTIGRAGMAPAGVNLSQRFHVKPSARWPRDGRAMADGSNGHSRFHGDARSNTRPASPVSHCTCRLGQRRLATTPFALRHRVHVEPCRRTAFPLGGPLLAGTQRRPLPITFGVERRFGPHCRRSRSRGILPLNVTAAAGRRKSRTKQGATLGSPRIDRP